MPSTPSCLPSRRSDSTADLKRWPCRSQVKLPCSTAGESGFVHERSFFMHGQFSIVGYWRSATVQRVRVPTGSNSVLALPLGQACEFALVRCALCGADGRADQSPRIVRTLMANAPFCHEATLLRRVKSFRPIRDKLAEDLSRLRELVVVVVS